MGVKEQLPANAETTTQSKSVCFFPFFYKSFFINRPSFLLGLKPQKDVFFALLSHLKKKTKGQSLFLSKCLGGCACAKKKSVAATRKGGESVNSLIVETTCVPVPHHLCKQKCTYVCRQESCNAPAFPSRLSSNSCRVSIVGGGCEFVSYFKIQIFSRS